MTSDANSGADDFAKSRRRFAAIMQISATLSGERHHARLE